MRLLLRNSLVFLILLSLYGVTYQTLLSYRQQTFGPRQETSTAWTLPPLILRIIAGEFKGLVADLITLEAGSLLGTEIIRTPEGKHLVVKKEYDWDTISRLFFNSQELDPAFQHTYMLAQGWLPWEGNRPEETQKILQTAGASRPWDWRPAHFRGFNTYYFLKNPGAAGKIFLEAGKVPNAPPFLAILGARLAQKGGETETAIALMKSMLIGKKETEPGYADIVARLQALEGVLTLEQAVARYQKEHDSLPPDLETLIARGLLARLPPNPYKLPYCLNGEGKIYFDRPNCGKAAGQ